jgi:NAD(P)-dependent dehydrogenase (short-subunit alcohol dehydrogenase family)
MRTILITGASSGIGHVAVKRFQAEGWNVVFTEPNKETTRIISLRKALSYERRRYEQYLKNRLV